ncbi:MAG: hypothetical protein JWP63_3537 [Candidatus Solibacter sp.]|nr:hypothetical protein [Candidatus Solibacter sp.]
MGDAVTCILIADDLTGACDAGVAFAARGLRTVVPLVPGTGDAQVIAISTESRDLPSSEIRGALFAAAVGHPTGSGTLLFKKIDSTLRGSVGMEIAAALEAFECDAAIVCPAFPKLHRVVEAGHLRVTSAPEFTPIHVAGHLGHDCRHELIDGIRAALEEGVRIVSVDAASDGDLDCLAGTILALNRRILWVGSGGLAAALARRLGEPCAATPVGVRNGPVLFCIGSDHPVTLAQQSALLAARPDHVLVRIPRGRISVEQVRERIGPVQAAALVVSGGDTASLVCRAASVQRIELCAEIIPGIPRGVLRGGMFDGLPVATKSGGFGDSDALIQVADFFSCPKQL